MTTRMKIEDAGRQPIAAIKMIRAVCATGLHEAHQAVTGDNRVFEAPDYELARALQADLAGIGTTAVILDSAPRVARVEAVPALDEGYGWALFVKDIEVKRGLLDEMETLAMRLNTAFGTL